MENVTKALLIAVGVLIAIIILSSLVIGYNQISKYYQERSNTIDIKQMVELNKKFNNYEGREIRGNEMLSVINMVVDYNEWVKQNPNQGYEEIDLNVRLEKDKYKSFHYDEKNYDYLITKDVSSINNNNMKKFSERISSCLRELQTIIPSATDSTVQSLSSNINLINQLIEKEESARSEEENKKIESLMNSIFKITDFSNRKFNLDNRKKINKIAHQYYEITQFKRAYFKCEGDNGYVGVELAKNGKVKSMNFKIKTDSDGQIKFN